MITKIYIIKLTKRSNTSWYIVNTHFDFFLFLSIEFDYVLLQLNDVLALEQHAEHCRGYKESSSKYSQRVKRTRKINI